MFMSEVPMYDVTHSKMRFPSMAVVYIMPMYDVAVDPPPSRSRVRTQQQIIHAGSELMMIGRCCCSILLASLLIGSSLIFHGVSVSSFVIINGASQDPSLAKSSAGLSLLADSSTPTSAFSINYQINELFKRPVPDMVKSYLMVQEQPSQENGTPATKQLRRFGDGAAPAPGSSTTIVARHRREPAHGTGLVRLLQVCVEEELLQHEMTRGKVPRGFGGYGTLGPFCYGLLLGPLAMLLQLPSGLVWSSVGIVFIYYTQFLLYDRVNEMIQEEGFIGYEPLPLWWTLPVFFPFNLIVGLRQVHFLADYNYRQRGIAVPPKDPVVDFFPFIGADRFTWQEFVSTPSLWCSLLSNVDPIDIAQLPEPLQQILKSSKVKEL
jgi:hypothetical protein